MAAIALESQNLVWQKVKKSLANATPAAQAAFRELKTFMATQKGNIDLQYVPFDASGVLDATGVAGPTGALTLYGFYGKKSGTGTTAAFLEVHNKNTITGSTDVLASLYFKAANDERFLISPSGIAFGSTTGTAVTSVTAIGGATVSTGQSDSQNGFLVVGA